MNFIFILPNKMAISHQVLSLGVINLINLAAVEKTKRINIIELQYCRPTGMRWRKIQKIN